MGDTIQRRRRRGARRVAALALCLAALAAPAHAPAQALTLDPQLSQSTGLAAAPRATRSSDGRGSYTIAPGDRVTVTVYREPDLSVTDAKVGPEGVLAFPLLGELHVAGLSSQALQRLVTTRLADGYLKNPNVTVNVDRQQMYFIKGEVGSPGGYVFVEGLTVEKAVALAGGFTERADEKDITVVRETAPDSPLKNMPPATRVLPGDVITVEESFF